MATVSRYRVSEMLQGFRVTVPKTHNSVKGLRGKRCHIQSLSLSETEESGQHVGKIFPKAFPEKTVRVMTAGRNLQLAIGKGSD